MPWAWPRPLLAMITAAGVCLAAHVTSGAPNYRIRLESFVVPPNRIAGLLVRARINGGPLLRLLVDSGSGYVVLDRATAIRSHCAGGTGMELIGAGAGLVTRAKRQVAETLELGDLTLRAVPVIVEDRRLADGIQGVLPLSVFSEFLIRLDFPAKELDLFPYRPGVADDQGGVPALLDNQLLFVKGTANETGVGYFLLDTGAALSAISHDLARQLHISEMMADRVSLRGGIADIDAPLWSGSIRLAVASHPMVTGPVVVVDLSTASRYHGFEISGLIGYSAMYDSILTASYRDRIIRIDRAK